MDYLATNIRSFIGAKDYLESRKFYKALDFEEIVIDNNMCLFKVNEHLAFYLQNAYVKDWVDNSMLFLEVKDLEKCQADLIGRNLPERFRNVRLTEIRNFEYGREIFMHDPSGILWHFCQFK